MSAIDREAVLAAAGPQLEALKDELRALVRAARALPVTGLIVPITLTGLGGLLGQFGLGVVLGLLGFGVFFALRMLAAARAVFAARVRVMAAVAPALGMTFHANPTRPVDLSAFRGTYWGGILPQSKVEDVLEGERRGARVMVGDAKLYGRSKGPDGEWRANEPPAWLKGVVFSLVRIVRVEAPGRWTARTVIMPDYGPLNRAYQPAGMEPVRLVDSRFEKTFEVFSTDQTEARALLAPDFMERLQALESLFKGGDTPPVAVFENGVLTVALATVTTPRQAGDPETVAREADITVDRLLVELEAVMAVVDACAGEEA